MPAGGGAEVKVGQVDTKTDPTRTSGSGGLTPERFRAATLYASMTRRGSSELRTSVC